MIIKSISTFLLIQSIFFYSCSNVNDNQEKLEMYQVEDNKPILLPDTIFACDTTQIGKLVWMAEDLQFYLLKNPFLCQCWRKNPLSCNTFGIVRICHKEGVQQYNLL